MAIGITVVFLLIYFIIFSYYRKGWKMIHDIKPVLPLRHIIVSVLIAARNEAENIVTLLNSLQSQTYSKENFEVIIVDDHSSDDTVQQISAHPISNVKVLHLAAPAKGKKKAIEYAIKQATGELVVTTDADCYMPDEWLETIVRFYQLKQSQFIAAPVKFTYSNRIVEKFQALDFMMLQGITASGIALNLHYMCNGANLAYTKNAFLEAEGFSGIDAVASGDDMLLMHKIQKNHPSEVHYLKSVQAIVKTAPMPSWRSFLMQRRRWASKNLIYDDFRIKAILIFVYVFNLWFFILLGLGFISTLNILYALIFMAVKACIEFLYLKNVAKFYKEEQLLKFLFFYQPMHLIYTVFTGLWSQFGNYEWKGRSTK